MVSARDRRQVITGIEIAVVVWIGNLSSVRSDTKQMANQQCLHGSKQITHDKNSVRIFAPTSQTVAFNNSKTPVPGGTAPTPSGRNTTIVLFVLFPSAIKKACA